MRCKRHEKANKAERAKRQHNREFGLGRVARPSGLVEKRGNAGSTSCKAATNPHWVVAEKRRNEGEGKGKGRKERG